MVNVPGVRYPVGSHIPSVSRRKCFFEFLRPTQLFRDVNGNILRGPSPGLTLCTLKRGHEGPHTNNRGEKAAEDSSSQVANWHKAELLKVTAQLETMQRLILAQSAKIEAMEEKKSEGQ